MKYLFKNLKLTLSIISWLQIIGGVTGLGLMAYLLLQTDAVSGPVLLIFIIGLSLFIFSVNCGLTLLSNTSKKKGIILSIINQAIQIFQWSFLGYGLNYTSGLSFCIGMKGTTISCNISVIMSSFSMFINSGNNFIFELNIAAVFLLVILAKSLEIIKAEKTDNEILVEATNENHEQLPGTSE